ncbi:hypothetical protein PHLH8_35210 [Pseudomonas sp. Pc102]|uniref:hypothetical protein n=1 Tax=Pseudomonas sp. Pc102 TaxID=2678261 RepID=UPI001BD15DCA|nr:hypothetical protein [Pseudomonas sp. Pc102]BBP83879.1 hypothetical protein PHLH8_35210 [Pseudomonas sp. Pc102]
MRADACKKHSLFFACVLATHSRQYVRIVKSGRGIDRDRRSIGSRAKEGKPGSGYTFFVTLSSI